MKFLAFLQDFPFPANNGIRADISRRLRAFHDLGHEVHVISWTGGRLDPALSEAHFANVRAVSASLRVYRIDRSWRRAARLWRYPSQIAARRLGRAQLAEIAADMAMVRPDALWIDGIHASGAGLEAARHLELPVVYRSHNREAMFLAEQAALADGGHRLSILASNFGLARWERKLMHTARFVADISADDCAYWRTQGVAHNRCLPPLADPQILNTASCPEEARDIDLFYVGGLVSPNNISGLMWFAREVQPVLRARMPQIRVVVAGRAPSAALTSTLTAAGIEVIPNPSQTDTLFARARVVFNPIFHGSGVNIKTVDMLASGRSLVTTTKGVRGLPAEVLKSAVIADTAAAFSAALMDAVAARPDPDAQQRIVSDLEMRLGPGALRDCIGLVAAALDRQ